MSRVFEALSRAQQGLGALPPCTGEDPWIDRNVHIFHTDLDQGSSLCIRQAPGDRLVVLEERESLGAEKFRVLATRLHHMQREYQLKTLVVTSAGPEEGKTLISANMSIALAAMPEQKVLLVEGDFRKPAITKLLGLPLSSGVVQHLESSEPVTKFLYRLSGLRLWILPAGARPERPLDIVQSPALDHAIRELAKLFTWIVIDSPPLLPMADTNIWARRADGVVLVVREGKTRKEELKQGLAALDNGKVVATVLNESSRSGRKYSYYYGYR